MDGQSTYIFLDKRFFSRKYCIVKWESCQNSRHYQTTNAITLIVFTSHFTITYKLFWNEICEKIRDFFFNKILVSHNKYYRLGNFTRVKDNGLS